MNYDDQLAEAAARAFDMKLVLPCPACRDEIKYWDEFEFNGGGPPPSFQVSCGYCGCSGPFGQGSMRGDYSGGVADAVKRWNEMPRR